MPAASFLATIAAVASLSAPLGIVHRVPVDVPPDIAKFIAWKDSGTYTYEANVRLELAVKAPTHAATPGEDP